MTVGSQIKKFRLERGMTQKQVADACGMADSAIRKYESGKITPKYDTLQRIAAALGTTVNWLLPPDNYWLDEQGVEHREPMWKPSEAELDRRLKESYRQLNFDGKQKAVERVEELTEIPRYQAPQSPTAPPKGTDTTPPPDGSEGPHKSEEGE